MKIIIFSLLFAGVAFGGAGVERTPTGVRLVRDGAVVWNFELATPEGRPFFHPLTLPGGRTLTAARPADHVWHLGYWFSWKFINGVNYWGSVASGKWGAGYAGMTLRLADETATALAVRGYAGGTTPGDCTARETTFLDFSDPATGA